MKSSWVYAMKMLMNCVWGGVGYHANDIVSYCVLTSLGGITYSFNWFLMVEINYIYIYITVINNSRVISTQ